MGKYAKAIVGALATGLTALLPALDDGAITTAEWVVVGIATIGALGVIWAVPNKAPTDVSAQWLQDRQRQP